MRQRKLAVVWGRYASSGTGSRLVNEEVLQALRASGLPDEVRPLGADRRAAFAEILAARTWPGARKEGVPPRNWY
ncbi:hypothetical protein [Streptomyces sp. NPDC005970]|uniref:hypothetical protein n=1 Tax=Streptomyces sp. NPDC005970 TaxID=3156723 RepID=UPI0034017D24